MGFLFLQELRNCFAKEKRRKTNSIASLPFLLRSYFSPFTIKKRVFGDHFKWLNLVAIRQGDCSDYFRDLSQGQRIQRTAGRSFQFRSGFFINPLRDIVAFGVSELMQIASLPGEKFRRVGVSQWRISMRFMRRIS